MDGKPSLKVAWLGQTWQIFTGYDVMPCNMEIVWWP